MSSNGYLVTIGLEVHAQVKTRTKMFCGCPTSFGESPNINVCPTCLGLPGALPVLNERAIEKTIVTGMMLGCRTPEISKWDRKNYFYADMPKNYQISQLDLPLCIGGEVPLYFSAYPKDVQKSIQNPNKKIRVNHIHLEEDVAKSTHQGKSSFIDFNRAGTPLMELVSEPDIESPEEAVAFLNSLRQILVYGDISDADMEKGQMRCDVNVSVRPEGQEKLNPKIELKNLNSTSAVRRALHYEIQRQSEDLDQGIKQVQSTRRWNDGRGETQVMRTKEDAHDYRYLPDPDLAPIKTAELVERARTQIPELPHEKCDRLVALYGVSDYDASVLAADRPLADYFEKAAKQSKSPKKIANWVINNVLSLLNEQGVGISEFSLPPEKLTNLVDMVEDGKLANNQAKEIFTDLVDDPTTSPQTIAKAKGFEPADTGEIEGIIDEVIASNPDRVSEIQGGNEKLVNWLTGQVMKASKGKANPKMVTESIRGKLL